MLKKYSLDNWFKSTFTADEQNILISSYPDFTDKNAVFNSDSAAFFLANSLMWYNKKDNADICVKVINKIEDLLKSEDNIKPIDLHFLYMHLINTCYKLRDKPHFLEKSIIYCTAQIAIAPVVKDCFSIMPEHTGYKQLCIISKKNKEWARVVELCNAAISQGWAGDWQKRIDEANKYL